MATIFKNGGHLKNFLGWCGFLKKYIQMGINIKLISVVVQFERFIYHISYVIRFQIYNSITNNV